MDVAHDIDPVSEVDEVEHDEVVAGTEEPESSVDRSGADLRPPRGGKVRAWLGRRKKAADPGVDWTYGTTLTTKVLQGAFTLALISGPIALGLAAMPSGATNSTAGAGEGAATHLDELLAADRAEVSAEQLVTTWLTATQDEQDRVRALVAAAPTDELSLPEKRPTAPTQVWAADADQTAPGNWQVTVGAITKGQTTWYAVAVHATAESAQALSLPGHASPPAPAQLSDPFPEMVDAGDPAADTVAGYVQALLTGSGDLDRWTSPDARITPVESAPCETAELLEVRSTGEIPPPMTNGEVISVLASALCVRGEVSTSSQYPLTLTARDGRWEVSRPAASDLDSQGNRSEPPTTSDANPTPESSPTR